MKERLQTGASGLDELLDGGLPDGGLVEIFGEKAVGKSILCYQIALSAATSTNVLIVDTELGYEKSLIPYWTEPLSRRFGRKVSTQRVTVQKKFDDSKKRKANEALLKEAFRNLLSQYQIQVSDIQLSQMVGIAAPSFGLVAEKNDSSIYLLEEPGLVDLMHLHGIDGETYVTEGGRVEFRLRMGGVKEPEFSPIGNFVRENGIGLVIYDSISAPAKATFIGTQDLPARSSSFAFLLGQAQKLSSRFSIPILAVNHISVHPHNPAWTHPYGGLIVGYDFKYVFHLEKEPATSKLSDYPISNRDRMQQHNRLIWAYRHPRIEEYGLAALLLLDDTGFH
ncbi:MAG: ATPase domain-containing protein [Conexivisphaerales archaeon]